MMLFTGTDKRQTSWHVGEPMRIPEATVLHIQVDGQELRWLLDTLAVIAKLPEDSHSLRALFRIPSDPLSLEYPATDLPPIL